MSTINPTYYSNDLTPSEQRLLGVIFIIVILICIIAYLPVLWILTTKKYFNRHFAYRLLIQMGFIEIFYLMFYFQNCCMMIMNMSFGRVMGVLIMSCRNGSWLTLNMLTIVLAINRCDVTVGFLSCLGRRTKSFFKLLLCLSYICGFSNLAIYLIPGFQAESNGLSTIRDSYNKQYLVPIMTNLIFGLTIIAAFFYFIAIIKIVLLKMKMSSTTDRKPEWSLFIQSAIICGYKSGLFFVWTFCHPDSKFTYGTYWFFTIFEIGYSPFMYYVVNK